MPVLYTIVLVDRDDCWLQPDGNWKSRNAVKFDELKLTFVSKKCPPIHLEGQLADDSTLYKHVLLKFTNLIRCKHRYDQYIIKQGLGRRQAALHSSSELVGKNLRRFVQIRSGL